MVYTSESVQLSHSESSLLMHYTQYVTIRFIPDIVYSFASFIREMINKYPIEDTEHFTHGTIKGFIHPGGLSDAYVQYLTTIYIVRWWNNFIVYKLEYLPKGVLYTLLC